MATSYPSTIDGYAQIRQVRDGIDEIVAGDHNSLRSAIIAIEQTLGVNPQGMFGTVVARLNDAYSNIEAHVLGGLPRHADTVIDSAAKSGSPFSLTVGTVSSQLVALLGHANSLSASAVDTFLGLTDTPSSFSGKDGYDLRVNDAGSSVEFSGERTNLLGKAIDSFVVSGMAVTQSGINAVVASGEIYSNGRMLPFAGTTLTTPGSTGTYYVSANIVDGAVVVATPTTSVDTAVGDSENTKVLLHRFTHNGATWTSEVDLRRFGMLINNKDYLTVGTSPSGYDGYGADFGSLRSAVEHAKTLNSATSKSSPLSIKIINNITISTSAETAIALDTDDFSIDGGGHEISCTVDNAIFAITANNIRIKDIAVDFVLGAGSTAAALARIADGVNVTNIHIEGCSQTSTGANIPAYFIQCGDTMGISTVTDMVLSGNNAEVNLAGVNLQKASATVAEVVNNSVISNNRFYQGTFAATGESCIRVGEFCVVDGNIIEGGFDVGIELEFSESAIVSNNLINGGTGNNDASGTPLMVTGIAIRTSGADFSSRCLVDGNLIKGITTVGIDDRIVGDGYNVMVSNNIIDNTVDVSTSMIGISAGDNTQVVNNLILVPGDHGIESASNAIGNQIYNGDATLASAIECASALDDIIICGNYMYNCPAVGININSSNRALLANNILVGSSGAVSGISNPGVKPVIVNNVIYNYGSFGGLGISVAGNGADAIISGNLIDAPQSDMTAGISLGAPSDRSIIIGNKIGTTANNLTRLGIDVGGATEVLVANNYITGYGTLHPNGGGIYNIGDESVVSGNYLENVSNIGIENDGYRVLISNNYIAAGTATGIETAGINCSIVGNYIEGSANYAIETLANSFDSIIANNYIEQPAVGGINVTNFGTGQISGNYIYQPTGIGIELIGGLNDDVSIIGNYVNGTDASTIGGIDVASSNDNVKISNNYVRDPSGNGIAVGAGCLELVITNNYIASCGSNGISVGGAASNQSLIAGNYIESSTNNGIGFVAGANSAFIGNYINGCTNGIQIFSGANLSLIEGNYINNHTGDAIECSGVADLCIVGNCNANPGSSADGVGMTTVSDTLLVGNRMIVQSGQLGFDITTSTTEVTAAGNLSQGGDTPDSFIASNNIDGNSCRKIT